MNSFYRTTETPGANLEQAELLEHVEDGVGLEEERERALPDLQTGAAKLSGEFGGARAGFGRVKPASHLAVEEIGDQRKELAEKGERGLLLAAEKRRQGHRTDVQRGKLGKGESEKREKAEHVHEIVGRTVTCVLLTDQLAREGETEKPTVRRE